MKIQLVDRDPRMCHFWEEEFDGENNVSIHCVDFFHLPTDCVVSPANSFGFMDGSLDLAISRKLGWKVQKKLQQQIRDDHDGELLVGQAELVETENDEIPYCISAPTMRVPMILKDTPNAYLASKAIFKILISKILYPSFSLHTRINISTVRLPLLIHRQTRPPGLFW